MDYLYVRMYIHFMSTHNTCTNHTDYLYVHTYVCCTSTHVHVQDTQAICVPINFMQACQYSSCQLLLLLYLQSNIVTTTSGNQSRVSDNFHSAKDRICSSKGNEFMDHRPQGVEVRKQSVTGISSRKRNFRYLHGNNSRE